MTDDEIIEEAVKRAQKIANSEGLNIGNLVAHPDHEQTYKLVGVEGEIAIVSLPAENGGQEPQERLPLNELFDPNVAHKLTQGILREQLFSSQN